MGVLFDRGATMYAAELVMPASSAASLIRLKLPSWPQRLPCSNAERWRFLHCSRHTVLQSAAGAQEPPLGEEWTAKITEHLEQASLLQQLRVVDALENLGIDRFFDEKIGRVLSKAFRVWNECEGDLKCIESAAIFFRLLRYHGYPVSADFFQQLTTMDNAELVIASIAFELYLASQVAFPGEAILKELNALTTLQLEREKFTDMVSFAIKFPWHSVLPRVHHRHHICSSTLGDGYLGNVMLSLARYDFNSCQLNFQNELNQILKWCDSYHLAKLDFARNKGTVCYFSVAATLFEPSMSIARLTWAKMSVLTTVFDDYFDKHDSVRDLRRLCDAVERWDPSILQAESKQELDILFRALYDTVEDTARRGSLLQGRDIGGHLRSQWDRLVHAFLREAEWRLLWKAAPTVDEYMCNAVTSFALEPILMSTIFFVGEQVKDEMLEHSHTTEMLRRVSLVGRILNDIQGYDRDRTDGEFSLITIRMMNAPNTSWGQCALELREIMQQVKLELVQDLLSPRAIPRACKRVFESMVKILSFFYMDSDGFTSSDKLKQHIQNSLFLPV